MSQLLNSLADKLGIATEYTFGCGGDVKHCSVNEDLVRFFVESLGYGAKDDVEVQKSLDILEKKRWQRALEAIYVVNIDKVNFDIVVSNEEAENQMVVSYAKEGKNNFAKLKVSFNEVCRKKERKIEYVQYEVLVENNLEPGYYDIKVRTSKAEYKTVLAIAPKKCYALDKKGKEKLFGFAIQLYSLKSERNWGVGDFTDLENMINILLNMPKNP